MSQENVEIVRAALDAYDRGDLEALRNLAASDCEVDWSRSIGPQRGVYGVDEALKILPGAAFESVRNEAEEFIDAGDHVITPVIGHFQGRDGIEVTARFTYLWTFQDRACVRITLYQERREALKAAGLEG
jgi:ketosteroid isomerase-like protein